MVASAIGSVLVAAALLMGCRTTVPLATAQGGAAGTTSLGIGVGTTAAAAPVVEVAKAIEPTGKKIDGTLDTPDGRQRTYHLYVPTSLPKQGSVPLIVALHGGVGSGQQFEANSGFDGLAEANRFLVVYPDGVLVGSRLMPNGRVWNGGACCGSAVKDNVDDVGFLTLLIDHLAASYAVDPAMTFAAGHSNGGIMSYRLACERQDKVAAIGVQAGWMAIDSCSPARPVSTLHIHGSADQNAPFNGGRGASSISGTDARGALDTVGVMARANGCSTPPTSNATGGLTTYTWPGSPPRNHCRTGASGRSRARLDGPRGSQTSGRGPGGSPLHGVGFELRDRTLPVEPPPPELMA